MEKQAKRIEQRKNHGTWMLDGPIQPSKGELKRRSRDGKKRHIKEEPKCQMRVKVYKDG
jgi:hypothetical protein